MSKRILAAREREKKALQMRLAGATYQEIGETLGISTQSAYRAVRRVMQRTVRQADESAEELRRLWKERLERLLAGLWERAIQGHGPAVDRALRICEREAKLFGLDMQEIKHVIEGHIRTEHQYDEEELAEWERIQLSKAAAESGGDGG